MSVRTAITDAFRAWLKEAAGGLTDAQCYREPFGGVKRPVPALSVSLTTYGIPEGSPEHHEGTDGSGNPTRTARTHERATVTVRAYGETAVGWLEDAVRGLSLSTAQETLASGGISVMPLGGLQDVSALVDTALELRAVREFEVTYAADSATETLTEATSVELEVTGEGDPSDLTETFTLT